MVGEDTGYWSPFAPGVFAIHTNESMPIFINGTEDNKMGLEGLAEDGDPSTLISSLMDNMTVSHSGVFNTPSTASAPGPLLPTSTYTFSFTASEGDYLNLATMLVQSNDLFMAFDDAGIALFANGTAISGDITASLKLWDAGTEVNEYPGAGNNQPLRQSGANTGNAENGTVAQLSDNFTYPTINELIKITISSN